MSVSLSIMLSIEPFMCVSLLTIALYVVLYVWIAIDPFSRYCDAICTTRHVLHNTHQCSLPLPTKYIHNSHISPLLRSMLYYYYRQFHCYNL